MIAEYKITNKIQGQHMKNNPTYIEKSFYYLPMLFNVLVISRLYVYVT